jgi:phosphatidylinositol-bisphosphatase
VFWCGDFNYRVDMDKEEMKELIKKGDYEQILQHDQLTVSEGLPVSPCSQITGRRLFSPAHGIQTKAPCS